MKQINKSNETKRINKIRKDKQNKFKIRLLKKEKENKIKATIQITLANFKV
jgi:hypothetical protein